MERTKRKLESEQPDSVRIQEFLDMIAPSVIKFNTDHFICGNTYRCVWALREYPTATDEQAILRHLGEKDGVTLKIYTRHVTPIEGAISSQMPADYADYIRNMRDSFSELGTAIGNISTELESGSLDSTRVKAIFYALFFGADSPSRDSDDYRAFADCFVRYEIRSNEAKGTSSKVAIPLTSLPEIYSNLESTLGRTITSEDKANASEIYNRILYGDIPTEGDGLQNWVNTITANPAEVPFIGGDFISPLGSSWRSMVTSEFGYRSDPIHPTAENFHSGIDLGAPKGTDIHAANGGTVLFVRYKTTGYGYHLAIDHGGGIVTLYGHCSKILVTEGQAVRQGEVIAQVGSTGKSTGNHLHFEVIVDGTSQNPRSYLP